MAVISTKSTLPLQSIDCMIANIMWPPCISASPKPDECYPWFTFSKLIVACHIISRQMVHVISRKARLGLLCGCQSCQDCMQVWGPVEAWCRDIEINFTLISQGVHWWLSGILIRSLKCCWQLHLPENVKDLTRQAFQCKEEFDGGI